MKQFKFLATLVALALTISGIAQANLIVNGGFQDWNNGFGSDYTFVDVETEGMLDAEGTYSPTPNGQYALPSWIDVQPQDGEYFFAANGSPDTNLSPWYQTITLSPGTILTSTAGDPIYYRFQAYIASLYALNPPQLAFEMSLNSGLTWQTLTTSAAPAESGQWYLTYRDGYFLTSPTTLSFRLRNAVSALDGNDMGIDGIYFGLSSEAPDYLNNGIQDIGAITGGSAAVPEPGTWAAAVLLLVAAGFARWRKRAKVA